MISGGTIQLGLGSIGTALHIRACFPPLPKDDGPKHQHD
jgi:hypothetical protein